MLLNVVLLNCIAYEIICLPPSVKQGTCMCSPSAGGWLMVGLMLPKVSCISLHYRQFKRRKTPCFCFYRDVSPCRAKNLFLGFSFLLAPQEMPVLQVFVWHGRSWRAVEQEGALAVCIESSFMEPWSWWRFQGVPSYRVDDKIRKEIPFSELCKDSELG